MSRPPHKSGPPRGPSRGPSSGAPAGPGRAPSRPGAAPTATRRPAAETAERPPRRGAAAPGQERDSFAPRGPGAPSGRDRRGTAPPGRGAIEAPGGRVPRPKDRRGMDPLPRPDRPLAAPAEATPPGALWLYGIHAVAAALANARRRARRLLLTEEAEKELAAALPRPWRVQAERADRQRFHTFLPEDSVHQGAALLVDPLPGVTLEEAIAAAPGPVLLLDQVTDPRNVGAILRSAAAFGAAAVVVQDRNAPSETAAMARTASGAIEVVPMVRAVNLARAIQTLQEAGFWVMGLAGDATTTLAAATPRDRRVALVLGAEDTGLRRLQRETVDELVRLPIAAQMESLNVSAAAAVALYELVR